MVAASAECALIFSLSPGNAGDAPQGRRLLERLGPAPKRYSLLMDRAYEGNETQCLSRALGYEPVVPPNPNRLKPWEYDKELYKKRNEVERLFRRLKGFRRIATRYDKLDVMFLAFIVFALIVEALK
ncbi:transposase [uncultured delta proteobacterium]|uniref:Transposase n=2 Tax=uncultured delta proteobacterium TaxID=34034 RepID=A0A212K8E2_9DELT|nr:transposase [uncultured delta proteobacterium]SBW07897.1 transposase [uncultured delta proteobacterium]SBW10519.1 transposase [uncultured delta proteobacterium]